MAPAAKTGNRLGLTSGKSRGAAARAGGKASASKFEPASAPKAPEPVSEPPERTYPKELLREAEGRPHLNVNDRRYDRLWKETQKQMEYPPIHSEGISRIDHILRVFDLNPTWVSARRQDGTLTSRFGPCMGLTRMERWQRARDIGDEPPEEIAEILETREGVLDLRLSVLDSESSVL